MIPNPAKPTRLADTVDAAHFFTRVLQVGPDVDIAQCRAVLLDRYGEDLSRVQSILVKRFGRVEEKQLRPIDQEVGATALPKLTRVAGLLLDAGSDLPILRLAVLIAVTSQRPPRVDPWFVHRDVDETSRVSYARRFFDDATSQGHYAVLARSFHLDPADLSERLLKIVAPLMSEVDKGLDLH